MSDGENDDSAQVNEGDLEEDRLGFLRRRSALAAGIVLVVVVAFGCWLAYGAFQARSNLEAARSAAQEAREALLKGNADETTHWVDKATAHARDAQDATHSLPWNIAAAVPWLGSPFKTGQQISDVVVGLAADVLQPSADVAEALSPDRLLHDGSVNVQLLRDSAPRLSEISASASLLGEQANAISRPAYFSAMRDARTQLQSQTSDVTGLLENTDLAARLAPAMMGADGPRTYFMAFQTNAEARGTGGLLGGFGILRFDNGKPTVDKLAPNTELRAASTSINLGPAFDQQWGWANAFTDFRNSNLSSHFPYAAQIWRSMWAEESGMNVDGVIALDPVALSYILGAVGPVTMPDGERITADNVVELTESTVYERFPTDQTARKQYLQDVASEVVNKITGRVESPRKLLDALGKATSERRIAVWSSSPDEQALLEETPLAHVVPDDAAPYAEVVINNLGGNKMDYYLTRQIEYAADGCDGETRKSTITVRLANTAPDRPLPDYVASSSGIIGAAQAPLNAPRGAMLTSVTLIATEGAQLAGAIANGQNVPVARGMERGHPTFEMQVGIPRGEAGEIKFLLSEPTSPGAPRVPIQPLIDDVTPVLSVPECSE
ncbi:DUF4012 domain-containing protein [Mycolicibacterium holsaticum]|uniref:DUF4012 domain-containing protein n=1 Tax=Mycolicibacterium holsaticum TaxID=152142 RepID=UPI001C7CC6FC|nr:DUF4012 domain-containing protein [Mycolicibacterium holsaticum]MDA4109417.1 membrane protein [Mycolicibacterium holsaticum DSM 44478 = JCM 12374]QZA11790.1 DUF4012 domain-containing protein [Mycolicibacterium holsaticum DSM 44478 = JCM 12374]UNC10722.1 DUF4012 domain-containing protein [Mycolicibacterium holsaticum DSM 44478 = JCM 12374]